MKFPRNIFLFFVFTFYVNTLLCQVNWGFRVGNSFNNFKQNAFYSLYTSSVQPSLYLLGIDIAFYYKIPLGQILFLQPEIHYLQKGGRILDEGVFVFTNSNPYQNLETKYRVDVIEIPILLKNRFNNIPFKPSVLFGFSFGYGVSHKMKGSPFCLKSDNFRTCIKPSNTNLGWGEIPGNRKGENFVQQDFSWVFGFSLEEKFRDKNLVLDVRYMLDVSRWQTGIPQLKHRNLLLTIGIEF